MSITRKPPRSEWHADKEEKKSYLLRKQQEEEAKQQLRDALYNTHKDNESNP